MTTFEFPKAKDCRQPSGQEVSAAVIDVTSRLERRAAFKRAAKGEPMTKEEVRDWYIAQPPDEQARFSAFMRALAAKQDDRPAVVLTVVEGDG